MIQDISESVKGFHFREFGSIVYLIKLDLENILIDTSSKENSIELLNFLKTQDLNPEDITTVILTHAHYDHVQNVDLFPKAKVYGNFTKIINEDHSQTEIENLLPIENLLLEEFKILKLPGHTHGDIAILYKNILFSGDVVFHGGYIGRNDFPESDEKEQQKSLKKLNNVKFDILCPGH